MSKQICWGVLGNALIGRACVIPAIQKSHNGTVIALGSSHPDAAEEVVEQHNIPTLYDSYDAVVDDPNIDAVYIPLPNHLHMPWTLKALAAGKHVLCEKPIALNAAEARQMADAAQAADRLLMEAFMYRFHPRSQRIKQMADDGELGDLRVIRSAFCFHLPPEQLADGSNIRFKPEMGGGALMDVGAYGVSVARWVSGLEPTAVSAQAVYQHGVDVNIVATLSFPNELLATVEASFVSALQQTYSIIGTQGVVDLPHDAFVPWGETAVFTHRQQEDDTGIQISTVSADQYQLMVEAFAQAILDQTPAPFPMQDSINNMRVLDAIAAAAKSGGVQHVER